MKKSIVIALLVAIMALAGCGGSASSSSSSAEITSVMKFATQYDKIATVPTNGIQNTGSNAFSATVGDYQMNLSETKANMIIEIASNGDYEGMKPIFTDVMTTLDPSLTDQASTTFDDVVASFGDEDTTVAIGAYRVFFSPPNDSEDGHIQVVIEK